jgi:dGTPase
MAISQVIGVMVEDMISETRDRLENHNIVNVEDIRKLNGPIVAFTDNLASADKAVKKFLSENMYRHHRVNRMTSKARRVVREIFLILFGEPELLPAEWRNQAENQEDSSRARIIADYISGMTDRYALEVHKKLFDPDALS